ncbi:hypothetical protein OXX69_004476 [Metschnikowia pulcherrima]
MRFAAFISVLALSLADTDIGFGTLHLMTQDNVRTQWTFYVVEETVKAGQRLGLLDFYPDIGMIVKLSSHKFLRVNEKGEFTMGDEPDVNFSMGDQSVKGGRRKLLYNGREEFQLCEDNTVCFNCTCEGARKITISYEETK